MEGGPRGEGLNHRTSHLCPTSSGGHGAGCWGPQVWGQCDGGLESAPWASGWRVHPGQVQGTYRLHLEAVPRPVTSCPRHSPSLCAALPLPLRGRLPGPREDVVDPPQGLLQDRRAQLVRDLHRLHDPAQQWSPGRCHPGGRAWAGTGARPFHTVGGMKPAQSPTQRPGGTHLWLQDVSQNVFS